MLRTFCVLLTLAQLATADDFVKQLTPKDLSPDTKPMSKLLLKRPRSASIQCAIPLKEVKVRNPNRVDQIAIPQPGGRQNFDRGIEHPLPMPVCPHD
jgi:hypothetical protein